MRRKWKPNKAQRKEFAIRMSDPIERSRYESVQRAKAEKRRSKSIYDYTSAGGFYNPTKLQYQTAFKMIVEGTENELACRMVMQGFTSKEKVHHDYIHVVNEHIRKNG